MWSIYFSMFNYFLSVQLEPDLELHMRIKNQLCFSRIHTNTQTHKLTQVPDVQWSWCHQQYWQTLDNEARCSKASAQMSWCAKLVCDTEVDQILFSWSKNAHINNKVTTISSRQTNHNDKSFPVTVDQGEFCALVYTVPLFYLTTYISRIKRLSTD